ncbi:MAG: universal stress protein [Thermoprotei archaeon]
MFKKILVPIDGSSSSEKAIKTALNIIKVNENALLTLLHVIEPVILNSATQRYDTLPTIAPIITMSRDSKIIDMKRGYEVLKWGKEIVTMSGMNINLETKVTIGSPADEIVREALQGDYDLIVISSNKPKGVKGIGADLINKIIKNTPCSIMIIK